MQNRIHLTGDDAGSLTRVREQGIEGIWSDKFSLSDSTGSYAIRFDVQFVGTGNQHYDVNVSNSYGRCDMLNWCTRTDWGPDYQDELAAHEFGHMIGAFDEYAGGATYDNFAATGTIMSDLTAALRPNFMNPLDHHAEQFTGRTFEIVDIPKNLTLSGNTWADSLHGRAGNDQLFGGGGQDRIADFSGAQNDRIRIASTMP